MQFRRPLFCVDVLGLIWAVTLVRFEESPEQAWGFYLHRAQLYANATPHAGFQALKRMVEVPSLPSLSPLSFSCACGLCRVAPTLTSF
jgi:hypothetical protein